MVISNCNPCGGSVAISASIIQASTGTGTPGPQGPAGPTLYHRELLMPTSVTTDALIVLYVFEEVKFTQIKAVMLNAVLGATVTWNVKHTPSVTGVGTKLFAADVSTTSISTGNCFPDEVPFTSAGATVPANSYVIFQVTGVSGTVDGAHWVFEAEPTATT